MSLKHLMGASSYAFAENITLDLHDIIGILLRERLLSDTRFQRAKLFEVSDGAWPASCLPIDCQKPFLKKGAPKVGYFLKTLEIKDEGLIVEPHNFLHDGLRCSRELDVEEVETIFWRIKNHDCGFLLHHALQLVLDYLPTSSTLRIRTSEGHIIQCRPQSFAVAEMDVLPKAFMYINNTHPRLIVKGPTQIRMDQYAFGEKYMSIPWVYLVFDEKGDLAPDGKSDNRVALDINVPALALRGLGGEPFAMERLNTYHNKILPRGADEDVELVHSPRILLETYEKAEPAVELAKRVLSRLERISSGKEKSCAYCGKAAPKAQCSKCRGKSKYCGPACQKKAWPYHKVWCKVDAAAIDKPNPDADVEMDG